MKFFEMKAPYFALIVAEDGKLLLIDGGLL